MVGGALKSGFGFDSGPLSLPGAPSKPVFGLGRVVGPELETPTLRKSGRVDWIRVKARFRPVSLDLRTKDAGEERSLRW